jgi:excisionase family DNA binding protein
MIETKYYLDAREAAYRLSVSVGTLRYLVAQGKLPVYRVGRLLRFRPCDLIRVGSASDVRTLTSWATGYVDSVDEYGKELEARGRADKYRTIALGRLRAIGEGAGWVVVQDISQAGFESWRRPQRLGAKTQNHYLRTLRSFVTWLVNRGELDKDPLAGAVAVREAGRERRPRRAYSDEELEILFGIMSPEHRLACLVALRTGLRRAEMTSLTWEHVELGDKPYVAVPAATAKNGKRQPVPLPEYVAQELRAVAAEGVRSTARVFRVPGRYAMKGYFRRSGVQEQTAAGWVDFHAFRHTYCTALHRAGVSLHLAQRLMRHSDARLTTRVYSDENQLPLAEAAGKLAPIRSTKQH